MGVRNALIESQEYSQREGNPTVLTVKLEDGFETDWGSFKATGPVSFDWGDGTINEYIPDGYDDIRISHLYTDITQTYTITITALEGSKYWFERGLFMSMRMNGIIQTAVIGDDCINIGGAFSRQSLTSISIPSHIRDIPDYAFSDNFLTFIDLTGKNIGEGILDNNPLESVINYDGKPSTEYVYRPYDDGLEICMYFGVGTEEIVPLILENKNIYAIGADAYSNRGLTSIILNEQIEKIGSGAFSRNSLTSITFPSKITVTPWHVCSYNNLQTINFAPNTTEIGGYSFAYQYSSLTNVEIPGTVKTIGNYAFYYSEVQNVIFNEGLETLGYGAFRGARVRDIVLPESLKSLGGYVFYQCQAQTLKLPTTNPLVIGECCFLHCRLTSVTVPANITEIKYLGLGRNALTELKLENPSIILAESAIKDQEYSTGGGVIYGYNSTKKAYYGKSSKYIDEIKLPTWFLYDPGSVLEPFFFGFNSGASGIGIKKLDIETNNWIDYKNIDIGKTVLSHKSLTRLLFIGEKVYAGVVSNMTGGYQFAFFEILGFNTREPDARLIGICPTILLHPSDPGYGLTYAKSDNGTLFAIFRCDKNGTNKSLQVIPIDLENGPQASINQNPVSSVDNRRTSRVVSTQKDLDKFLFIDTYSSSNSQRIIFKLQVDNDGILSIAKNAGAPNGAKYIQQSFRTKDYVFLLYSNKVIKMRVSDCALVKTVSLPYTTGNYCCFPAGDDFRVYSGYKTKKAMRYSSDLVLLREVTLLVSGDSLSASSGTIDEDLGYALMADPRDGYTSAYLTNMAKQTSKTRSGTGELVLLSSVY